MRLLLVEDNTELVAELLPVLQQAGYAVDATTDGEEAHYLGENESYDAVILDLGLPKRSGLEVLRDWRDSTLKMPVLILTARDTWQDKVEGLKAGADDYLAKTFHPEELLARLQALIRRSHGIADSILRADGMTLDEGQQLLELGNGKRHKLTGTEFRLLRYFMLNPDKPLSKTRLTEHLYDQEFDRDSNLIEVYVRRLREKIGRDRIETRRGQGYVFKS
jgi:two-component system OmpR family response regulator